MTPKEMTEYSVYLSGRKVKVRHVHHEDDSTGGRFEDYPTNTNVRRNVERMRRLREEIEHHEGIVNGVEEAIENSEIHRTWLDRKIEVGKLKGDFQKRCKEWTRSEDELEELRDYVEELRGLVREHEEEVTKLSEELSERNAKIQRDLAHEEANGVYADEKRARRTLEAFTARKRRGVKESRIRIGKLRKRLAMIERYEGTSESGEDR